MKNGRSKWAAQFVGCSDLSDPIHYSKLCSYISTYLMFAEWIWEDFISPEEVLAETAIWLANNNIKISDSDDLIKFINRRVNFLWHEYLKSSPKYFNYLKAINKKNKDKYRKNLDTPYLLDQAMRLKGSHDWGYVIQKINTNNEVCGIYTSMYSAAKENNLDRKWLSEIVTGKKKTAHGYFYKKIEISVSKKEIRSREELKNDPYFMGRLKERILEKRAKKL